MNTKKLIESDEPAKKIVGKLSESLTEPADTGFALKYLKRRGYYFEWVSGREKGMFFYPDMIDNSDHVRGAYENHPQFGDIRSDIHQIYDLVDNVDRGNVKVMEVGGRDVTSEAKRYAGMFFQETEGEY